MDGGPSSFSLMMPRFVTDALRSIDAPGVDLGPKKETVPRERFSITHCVKMMPFSCCYCCCCYCSSCVVVAAVVVCG